MKRSVLIYLLILSSTFILRGQNTYSLQFTSDTSENIINVDDIDSITYSYDGVSASYKQNIWTNNNLLSLSTDIVDTVYIKSRPNFRLLTKDEDGMDAIISSQGDFLTLRDMPQGPDSLIAIWGNINDEQYNYALIDSGGLINTIILSDSIYFIVYGNDSLYILYNNHMIRSISYGDVYDIFQQFEPEPELLRIQCGAFTRNPIYKTAKFLWLVTEFLLNPSKTALILYLRHFGPGDPNIRNFLVDILDFDLFVIIEWVDNIFEMNYFGFATITTLDPIKIETCKYQLGCYVSIPAGTTTYYDKIAYRGAWYDYSVTVTLKDKSIGGSTQSQSSPLASSLDSTFTDTITFLFQNLDIQKHYSVETTLNVEYYISDTAYWLGLKVDPIPSPIRERKRKFGEDKEFYTGTISITVGEAINVTNNSADIECSFANIPSGAEFGMKLCRVRDNQWLYFPSNASEEGDTIIPISELQACSQYTYLGYAKYKGVEYSSWNGGGLTTTSADLSGTWHCIETYYPTSESAIPTTNTYTITLNSDGTASCSEWDDIVLGAWTLSCDGSVGIDILIYATQFTDGGKDWWGTVNDINNPTVITGYSQIWRTNTIGAYYGDGHQVVMTKQ